MHFHRWFMAPMKLWTWFLSHDFCCFWCYGYCFGVQGLGWILEHVGCTPTGCPAGNHSVRFLFERLVALLGFSLAIFKTGNWKERGLVRNRKWGEQIAVDQCLEYNYSVGVMDTRRCWACGRCLRLQPYLHPHVRARGWCWGAVEILDFQRHGLSWLRVFAS